MTNGEKFKEIFGVSQVDEGVLYAFAWLPNHDAAEFSIDWWSAEYKEPITKNDVPENNVGKIDPTVKNDLAVDCVSREKVWYMITNGKYPNEDYEQFIDRLVNELSELPSVTPQYSSELEKNSKKLEKDFGELDCISRADAIQAMQDTAKKLTNEDTINGLCGAVAILFDLPSVTSIRPKGYWIDTNDKGFVYHRIYKCSHCGATVCEYPENMHESKYKYCSNCGSRNEVEE